MDSARWSRIQSLKSKVRALSVQEAHEALERECPGDPVLVYQVENLLKYDPSTSQFLEEVYAGFPAGALPGRPPSRTGTRVGPFVVEDCIGVGGQSEVYAAQRPEYGQVVALKFIAAGLLSSRSVASLKDEARTLARMNHSNIARFHGVEETVDGTPVLVMEYVVGRPLDEFLKISRLTIEARLQLFRTICAAVEAAHRNLIVHSDIKPSNIMVGEDGQPKLLDFGVAFHLDVPSAQARGMTLPYASPEQIAGAPIDTRTDVYSLGVLLYELISGTSPYPSSTTSSPTQLAVAIAQYQPKSPSARVKETEIRKSALRPARMLSRSLMVDLDFIVQRAMNKKPEDRYESVKALSDDIQRLLANRPVSVHPVSRTYIARKFLRRHPIGFATTIAAPVILASFATVTKLQAIRLAYERDKATSVASFLVDLFRVSDPSESKGRSITAKEVLDRGAAMISDKLRNEPVLEADLTHTMGQVYENLGLYTDAEKLYRSSLDLRRSALGPSNIDTIRIQASLGRLLVLKGEYKTGETLLDRTHQLMVAALGLDHVDVAEVLNSLGLLHHHLNKWAEAEAEFREALRINRLHFGSMHERVATNLENLALTFMDAGRPQDAEELLREVLRIKKALHGPVHPAVAEATVDLGLVMQNTGRLKEAEPLLREGLDLMTKTKGPDHPDTATAMTDLGMLLYFAGRPQEAKPLVSAALGIRQRVLGPENLDIVGSIVNLATVEEALGEFESAKQHHLSALSLGDRIFGPKHSATATIVNNLGVLYQRMGDLDNAERCYLEGLARRRAVFPQGNLDVGVSLNNLGILYYLKGDYPKSEQYLRDGLALLQKVLPLQHPNTAITQTGLARTLNALKKYSDARSLATSSLASLKVAFQDPHWRIADCQVVLGQALIMTNSRDEGVSLLRTGLAVLEQQRGPKDWRTKEAQRLLDRTIASN